MGRVTMQRHAFNPGSAERSHGTAWTAASPAGAIDVALADGHVEPSKLPNIYNYYWHNNWGQAPNTILPGTPK
jgi:prepilin-type processing-associated H-X9-DG protein